MLIDKARDLGIALSETPEFRAMLEAQKSLEQDRGVALLTEDFFRVREEVHSLLDRGDADMTDLQLKSEELESIRKRLFTSPAFIKAIAMQGEFQKLMDMVTREVGACIGIPMEVQEDDVLAGYSYSSSACKH